MKVYRIWTDAVGGGWVTSSEGRTVWTYVGSARRIVTVLTKRYNTLKEYYDHYYATPEDSRRSRAPSKPIKQLLEIKCFELTEVPMQ